MPPPAPIKCSAPDCAWLTPENLPTYDLVTTHLQLHVQTNHPPQAQPTAQVTSAKVDKRPRPEASQDMTEHGFRFFESE